MLKEKLPSTNMDNFIVDITAVGKEPLRRVLELIMSDYYRIVAYLEDDKPVKPGIKRLHLYKDYDANDVTTKFLYPLDMESCFETICGWLANIDYGPIPDFDDKWCSKGWRIRNIKGAWERIAFTVEPMWAEHSAK